MGTIPREILLLRCKVIRIYCSRIKYMKNRISDEKLSASLIIDVEWNKIYLIPTYDYFAT